MTPNKELMTQARLALSGKWETAVGAFFIYMMISVMISIFGSGSDIIANALTSSSASQFSPISTTLSILIGGPFYLGIAIFTLAISRNDKDARMEQIFHGFKSFLKAFATYSIIILFTSVWMLLFIIPGIIAIIAYSQAFYILTDTPEMSPIDAIKKSRKMMNGYKWKFLCLNLRFAGWAILSILTFGIGLLWLVPYVQVSMAKFYDDIKANPFSNELEKL